MKILLVDRDVELAALTAFALRQAGYETCLAEKRSTALQMLELERPDLTLLDHRLPDLDSVEICREFRRRTATPIMVLSAQAREEDLVAAVEAGADDYLRKPLSPRVLVARVRSLLRTVTSERLQVHLWGSSSRESQQTLKQLVYRLRRKIEADPSAPRLIVTTPHAGYRLAVQAAV